jgi:two-component system, cell cycle sensor histidine kinase and response regulator CckA
MSKRGRVLVVEDEEIILADVTRQLRKQGYVIAGTASSGTEAIRAAGTTNPDIVLMDLRLQGRMNGLEAARQIREASAVPILFVSAHAGALAASLPDLPGRNRVLLKPFSPSELHEAIEAMLA